MIDFDPALAIGTADEFLAKPLPASRHHTRRGEPKVFQAQKQDRRTVSVDAESEACAAQSELLTLTDRYLAARGKDARRAALDAWMKLRGAK